MTLHISFLVCIDGSVGYISRSEIARSKSIFYIPSSDLYSECRNGMFSFRMKQLLIVFFYLVIAVCNFKNNYLRVLGFIFKLVHAVCFDVNMTD